MALVASPYPPPHPLPHHVHGMPDSSPAYSHSRLLRHLEECTDISQLKRLHAHALRNVPLDSPRGLFLQSRILHFSASRCADLNYALRVFDQIETPNSFMWNTLIRAFAVSKDRKEEAISLFQTMMREGSASPDKHTFPFVLKACAYLFAMAEGQQVHAQLLKCGLDSDVYVNNSLIHFYGSCKKGNNHLISEAEVVLWFLLDKMKRSFAHNIWIKLQQVESGKHFILQAVEARNHHETFDP
ncbi:hypothetical protein SAY87_001685 [Trapa incisa]|uniref:Pentatricopeptide repeat-containing protein n=1 Tax=Trapa incisa TaxID=236973 RepID=A0AAN7JTS0_9MYRT|nr:hypothetical protein SAY87_001685 [Trapa incisa]